MEEKAIKDFKIILSDIESILKDNLRSSKHLRTIRTSISSVLDEDYAIYTLLCNYVFRDITLNQLNLYDKIYVYIPLKDLNNILIKEEHSNYSDNNLITSYKEILNVHKQEINKKKVITLCCQSMFDTYKSLLLELKNFSKLQTKNNNVQDKTIPLPTSKKVIDSYLLNVVNTINSTKTLHGVVRASHISDYKIKFYPLYRYQMPNPTNYYIEAELATYPNKIMLNLNYLTPNGAKRKESINIPLNHINKGNLDIAPIILKIEQILRQNFFLVL